MKQTKYLLHYCLIISFALMSLFGFIQPSAPNQSHLPYKDASLTTHQTTPCHQNSQQSSQLCLSKTSSFFQNQQLDFSLPLLPLSYLFVFFFSLFALKRAPINTIDKPPKRTMA